MTKEAAETTMTRVLAKATTIHDLLPVSNSPAKCLSSIKTTAAAASNSNFPHFGSESSAYNSPSLISPPSSAFVSALQSPYISPRAFPPSSPEAEEETKTQTQTQTETETENPPPVSGSGSLSDDIPSSSYTPPPEPERSDFSDDGKLKFVAARVSNSDSTSGAAAGAAPRISFSFPVPRVSFAKASVSISPSPAVNAKLRSCDVFIGYHGGGGGGQNVNLVRFCKWLKSELELQGIACFVADRARYADNQSHEIADRVICSVTFGIVVISAATLFNPFSMEEVRFFAQKKNLLPMFFDTDPIAVADCSTTSADKERREAIEALIRAHHDFKLEAKDDGWRSCVSKAANILQAKLGRKSVNALVDKVKELEPGQAEELPFPRNKNFVGRQREMMELESAFFGNGIGESSCVEQQDSCPPVVNKGSTSGQSEGFADEETDMHESSGDGTGRFISLDLEMTRTKGLNSDRNSLKRSKYKKSRSGRDKSCLTSSVISISGPPGVGKTELALEFAHRFSHRYKMVLWLGGEAQYLRQNILNLSTKLGLDVSADPEKERGRIRSFEEQEHEAFKRLKRELFRDMPYLIIMDHLETENEWWEGKDLHDLIPRNTGGSHVIITTRLSKVMNFDPMQLQPLPLPDAMVLIRGRRKKDYPAEEYECLKKIEENLGRSTLGLSIVGSLLSELAISPSALFEVLHQAPFQDSTSSNFSSANEEQLRRSNTFLIRILEFCFAILEKATRRRNCLASRMFLVGAWFAPSPISVNLLTTAAKSMPTVVSPLKKWTNCLNLALGCCSGCPFVAQPWKSEEESALLLVKLGMARKATYQPGLWIQFHPITRSFARAREGSAATRATVVGIRKTGNPMINSDHLWASAFLVFGFKSEPPIVQLKATDMVLFIKKTALPLAIGAFTTFSRCNSALELLKVCTGMLEEVEKSFVSQIQDWCHGSFCWKKKLSQSNQRVDEYVWQEVTLLKATLLETRAKLLLRGGYFDSAEELCRTCISIRTVMLGHNHPLTLAS